MPPRILFRGKLRPGQFEFPCCGPCNQGTRHTDQLIAYLSRLFPEETADQADIQKILRGLKNNMPTVLQKMYVGRAGQKLAKKRTAAFGFDAHGGVLRLNGPIVSRHLDIFGCKLASAMHWEMTKAIIPPTGGIVIRFYTNVEAAENKRPASLLKLLPSPQTLRQGIWDVADQFQYSAQVTDGDQMGVYFATFRFSFAIAAVVAMDRSLFPVRLGPIFLPAEPWSAA